MTRTVLAAAAVLAATAGATAQNADPAFDVVSIKRNTSLATGGGMRPQPGGRITATNLPVRSLIGMAYGIPTFNRILGLPDWAAEERYNIDAQAPQPHPSAEDLNAMMRTLLRERFGLVARRETRELPVYSLVQTRQGVLGSKLRAAAVDCADPDARKRAARASREGPARSNAHGQLSGP